MGEKSRLFGTDGVRSTANVHPMTPDFMLRLGQAIGVYFRQHYEHPKILIGKDTRRSGYMLEQALGAGICSVGVDVLQLGPLPTPGIAYLTRGLRACAGIVISASHNPFQDNGIKIFDSQGFKLPDSVEDQLEALVERAPDLKKGMDIGRAKRVDDAVGQYAVFLKEQFPKDISLDGMRIVLDCANGASYKVAPKVFEELGAEIFCLGVTPNGRNINEACGALYPQTIAENVRMYKADLGLAFDGDADRLIVIDHHGQVIDGDIVMGICAKFMAQCDALKSKTLVTTVMSNMGLDISLAPSGVSVERTKVGDRYVVEAMRRGSFNLGGEQSGHLVFMDSSTTGDGILAALHLLKVLISSKLNLEEASRSITLLPQKIFNVPVSRKTPVGEVAELSRELDRAEAQLKGRGRVLFRYSGTESLARLMLEGQSHEELLQIAQPIVAACERYLR